MCRSVGWAPLTRVGCPQVGAGVLYQAGVALGCAGYRQRGDQRAGWDHVSAETEVDAAGVSEVTWKMELCADWRGDQTASGSTSV